MRALWVSLVVLSTAGCNLVEERQAGFPEPGYPGYQKVYPRPEDVPGGNPEQGRLLVQTRYGCGACHVIPSVPGANGKVGPPLIEWAQRVYIAGNLPNTPQYLVLWIQNPQAVEPGTAMPDMGVTEADARDIAAFLYTLR